jgi:hypothetical protein
VTTASVERSSRIIRIRRGPLDERVGALGVPVLPRMARRRRRLMEPGRAGHMLDWSVRGQTGSRCSVRQDVLEEACHRLVIDD